MIHVSEAYVTKMLKKLEKKEYIERRVNENNKSKKNLYLTEKGHSLTSDVLKITKEWENKIMKSVEDIDDEKFNRILYKLAFTSHEINES